MVQINKHQFLVYTEYSTIAYSEKQTKLFLFCSYYSFLFVCFKDDVKTSVTSASVMLNETQNATLECSVSGCPASFSIRWSKDGQPLNEFNNSLVLNSVKKSDAGQYSCFAHNNYTNSSSKIQVTVNCK